MRLKDNPPHLLSPALSPAAGYPSQFRHAVLAPQHVLKSGIPPTDIVISGDSAGGMLVMQVISQHLHPNHPNPSIPSMPIHAVPFAGVLTISPLVAFESNAPSFVNNGGDALSHHTLLYFAGLLRQNSVPTDPQEVPEEY
jgi:acetyl esterase/lipase